VGSALLTSRCSSQYTGGQRDAALFAPDLLYSINTEASPFPVAYSEAERSMKDKLASATNMLLSSILPQLVHPEMAKVVTATNPKNRASATIVK